MTSQDLAQVFENVFLPQIQKAQGGSKTGSGTAALQSFTKLFAELDKQKWEKGSSLQISRYPKRNACSVISCSDLHDVFLDGHCRLSDGATIAVKDGKEPIGFVSSEMFHTSVSEVFLRVLMSEDAQSDVIRSLKLFRRRDSRKRR